MELTAARGCVRRHQLVICPSDLLVKSEVGRAAKTPALRVLVKDTAEKERIITDVRPEQKRLFRSGAGKGDQHIGNILAALVFGRVRRLQTVHPRKGFEKRSDVITKLPIGDADISQDVTRKHVKIKMRRDTKLTCIGQDRFD